MKVSRYTYFLHFTFVFFLILFIQVSINGQQPPSACIPPIQLTSICETSCVLCDISGFTGYNDITTQGQSPPGFCAPQLHNTQWIGFVAGSDNMILQIDVYNCNQGNGLQVAIYETIDCSDFSLVSECYPAIPENTFAVFNTTVQAGGIYFFVIDGNVGDICNFTITILSGSGSAPVITENASIIAEEPFCAGATFPFSSSDVFGASIYNWTINGQDTGYTQATDIVIPTNGSTFEVCVTPANPCYSGSEICETYPITYGGPIITPQLNLPASGIFCDNSLPIVLDTMQDNIPGAWSGTGVIDNFFYPAQAGPGAHELLFTPNPGQCANSATITATVEEVPVIQYSPPPILSCDDGVGLGFFNLSSLEDSISGGVGEVFFFLDAAGDYPIVDPSGYVSGPGTIYAFVLSPSGCLSEPVPIQLEVQQGAYQSPISCVSTVCEGEMTLYTTQAADCASYVWSISEQGEILGGGASTDTFVLVRWIEAGTGTISLLTAGCSGVAYCSEPTVQQVPILGESVEIVGKETVCKDDFAVYTLPPFEGVDIHWTVSALGEIVSGQGTPRILVRWATAEINPAPQWVSATFQSCFLNCGGADTLEVALLPRLYLRGPAELCEGTEDEFVVNLYGSNNAVSCYWRLENESGDILINTPGTSDTFHLIAPDMPGLYKVIAQPMQSGFACQDSIAKTFRVAAPPPPVEAIIGDTLVCPGNYAVYQINSNPLLDIRWEIQNGAQTTITYGSDIIVEWGSSPPYQLTATQAYRGGPRCFSAPTTLSGSLIPLLAITGDSSICTGNLGTYIASENMRPAYNWEIIPHDAGTILNSDTAIIQVDWKYAGNAIVRLNLCGQTVDFPVIIHPLPTPILTSADTLCGDEMFQHNLIGNYQSIQWFNEDGDSILPTQIDTGFYRLHIISDAGCSMDTTIRVIRYPKDLLTIFTNRPCYVNTSHHELYTLETNNNYHHQWYLDGQPIGTDTAVIAISDTGYYHLDYIDQYGCSYSTDSLLVINCQTGGGDTSCICPDREILIDTLSGCDNLQFTASFTQTPLSYYWVVYQSESLVQYFYDTLSFSFLFPEAGPWTVSLWATFPDPNEPDGICTCGISEQIIVPSKAKFAAITACAGQYAVFRDESRYIPNNTIESWHWNFGDTASMDNIATVPNPVHLYSQADTFEVILTIVDSIGCSSSYVNEVIVYPSPTSSFEAPAIVCPDESLLLRADSINVSSDISWHWQIATPINAFSINNRNQTYIRFDTSGLHHISLITTNIFECRDTVTHQVLVPSRFTGDISATPALLACSNETIQLQSPPGAVSWLWTNGATTSSLAVDSSGVFGLEVTDSTGCVYDLDEVAVYFPGLPYFPIRAITPDEFGQPAAYTYDSLTICEGNDVFLETIVDAGYTIQWSTGNAMTEIEFSEDRNSQLPAGTHHVFLEIQESSTGCTDTVFFPIIVHPNPVGVAFEADTPAPWCEGTPVNLTVINPDPGVAYVWNTRDTTTTLTTSVAGYYSVQAINSFGCEATSDSVQILEGPNLLGAPSGCYNHCRPDTLCLPDNLDAVSYEWLFDGNTLGQDSLIAASQSGVYQLQATNSNGCTSLSLPLELSLYDDLSFVQGFAYFDVNNDGYIDPLDSLLTGVQIVIQGAGGQYTATTIDSLGYFAPFLPGGAYSLWVDTLALGTLGAPLPTFIDTTFTGCNQLYEFNWLLRPVCPAVESTLNLSACEGETVQFNGITIIQDTTFVFLGASINGCDSIIHIDVEFHSQPTVVANSETSCRNLPTGSISLSANTNAVEYSLDGVVFQPTGEFIGLLPGEYFVFYRESGQSCIYQDTVVIDSIPVLQIESGNNTLDCPGDTLTLQALVLSGQTEQMSYVWDDQTSLPNRLISAPGIYSVEVQNGCESQTATFTITLSNALIAALAIPDTLSVCLDSLLVTGNLPPGAEGFWSSPGLLVFDDPEAAATSITTWPENDELAIWNLSTDNCPNYSSDTIHIRALPAIVANNDILQVPAGASGASGDLLLNDFTPGEVTIELLDQPTAGSVSLSGATLSYTAASPVTQEQLLRYLICWVACPGHCAEAQIAIVFEQPDFDIPNAITPNGDGLNEMLIFDFLDQNPDEYPDNEIIIFNRWADIVFQAKPYLNNWRGTNQQGKPLPHGTYYYILRLDIANGEILTGHVTIME
jgi:gliding motility-associated-like protein